MNRIWLRRRVMKSQLKMPNIIPKLSLYHRLFNNRPVCFNFFNQNFHHLYIYIIKTFKFYS
jgi:hypothetical protein